MNRPQVKRRLDEVLASRREAKGLPAREVSLFLGDDQLQLPEDPEGSGNGFVRAPEVTINRSLRRGPAEVQKDQNMESPGLVVKVPKIGPLLGSLAIDVLDRVGLRSSTPSPGSLP
jgi:hypothetical protein